MKTLNGAAEPPKRPLAPAVVTPWPSTTALTWTTRPVTCWLPPIETMTPQWPSTFVWWLPGQEETN